MENTQKLLMQAAADNIGDQDLLLHFAMDSLNSPIIALGKYTALLLTQALAVDATQAQINRAREFASAAVLDFDHLLEEHFKQHPAEILRRHLAAFEEARAYATRNEKGDH